MSARTTEIGIAEARARLGGLISRAEAGEEIVVTRRGRPVARIVAVQPPKQAIPSFAEFRATMPRMRTSSARLVSQLRDEEADR
jgi:prevent-host-death family protein